MRTETIGPCTLILADCREAMAAMAADSVHACVTDPPYELGFMGKAWDKANGVASDPATWEAVRRVLTPGGHVTAFAGSRTYHRIAMGIERGGFDVRDMLMWLYGSGFPKSLDVAKDLDKRGGGCGAVDRHAPSLTTRNARSGNITSKTTRAAPCRPTPSAGRAGARR